MGGLQSKSNVTVSEQISTDSEFYYRELSVFPSKLATVQYSIKINRNIADHCVGYKKCSVCLAIYTTEDDHDLKTNCIHDSFASC